MSSSAKPLRSINPATGEEFARYEPLGADAIEARLARAAEAYRAWRKVPIAER
ncbi:aldehyde dehydrogenase family protein, partial [Glaesserella parasuis]|uniref:aldehyde dehydrogenase family protein n=1 Tax=Glaesserella parasuis TaxID=738 RepID=UPI003B676E35